MKRICTALMVALVVAVVVSPIAFAQAGHDAQAPAAGLSDSVKVAIALAMGFGLAIAVFGGAIGQSKGIAASVEALARQPEASGKIMGAMIIGLALIETLVIYMLLICFMLMGKLG